MKFLTTLLQMMCRITMGLNTNTDYNRDRGLVQTSALTMFDASLYLRTVLINAPVAPYLRASTITILTRINDDAARTAELVRNTQF